MGDAFSFFWALICLAANPLAVAEPEATNVTFILSFECPGQESEYVEGVVEQFTLANGFQVVNKNKFRREADVHAEGMEIWGMDSLGHILRAKTVSPSTTRHKIYLDNYPPAALDKALEDRMRNEIIYQHDCNLGNIAIRSDDHSRREQYQILKDIFLRLFKQVTQRGWI